jgi:hypothetical protein
MPESSLRWGGRLGALGAALGVFAYIVGSLLTPLPAQQTTGEAVIPVILVRGLFVWVALGVVFGLAFYVGMRVGREELRASSDGRTVAPSAAATNRVPAVLAGGLVVVIWWLATRFVSALVAFPPVNRFTIQDLPGQIAFGVLFVCIGAGLGGVGARMAFTNKLAEAVIVVSQPLPAAPPSDTARAAAPAERDETTA